MSLLMSGAVFTPTTIQVVPDGDLWFLISENNRAFHFRISEAVVRRTSRQLDAALTLLDSQGGPRQLAWKATDPAAYWDFFKIIHEQSELISQPSGQRLAQVARIAAKHDCVDAVSPYILHTISDVVNQVEAAADNPSDAGPISDLLDEKRVLWEDLMDIALFCHLNKLFWSTTRVATMQANTELVRPFPQRYDYGQLPTLREEAESIYDQINSNRRSAAHEYITNIYQCIGEGYDSDGKFVAAQIRYGALVYSFMEFGIDPTAETLYPGSLFNAVAVAEMVIRSKADDIIPQPLFGGYLGRDIQDDLSHIKARSVEAVPGICLECLLSNEKNVEIFHDEECPMHPFNAIDVTNNAERGMETTEMVTT